MYFFVQNGRDPDEEVLQGEPRGQDRLPEGRRLRHQEAQMVPGTVFLVPYIVFKVPEVVFVVPCMGFIVSGLVFMVPGALFMVPGMVIMVPGMIFMIPGMGIHGSRYGDS